MSDTRTDKQDDELTGTVIGAGCSTFEVERDRVESTRIAAQQRPSASPPTTPRPSPATPAANRQQAAAGRTFCYWDSNE